MHMKQKPCECRRIDEYVSEGPQTFDTRMDVTWSLGSL